jgi:branched-chain amino acid transport system substrate-binding protein
VSAAAGQLSGTIKIVSSLPRTGANKGQTDTMSNAIKMALADVNNRVGGATLVYQDMDDATAAKGQWDAAQEASNANTAIADPDTVAYIGTFNSGAAAVSIPILCAANMGMVSPANTYPGLTKKVEGVAPNEPDVYYPNGCKRNYTRVIPTDEIQGAVAANWSKQLGATKAYVLDDTQLYGHGIASFYASTAQRIGLQVVGGPEGIDPQASDYRALAQKIRAAGADVVFAGIITPNNAGKLWQDLRDTLGPNVRLMGPDGIYEQAFIDAAGPAAEGTYITFGGIPPSKLTGKGADWYQRYKQQFNDEPAAYAAYAYEAASVVIQAVETAAASCAVHNSAECRGAVRDAIFNTKNFNGVLGTWSFTDTGDTTLTTMSGRQVKNGMFDDANAVVLTAPQ